MPIVLQGEGQYVLSAIKTVEVTEAFVGLGEETTDCTTEEYSLDCLSRKHREKVLKDCQCSPWNLKSYYGDEVT